MIMTLMTLLLQIMSHRRDLKSVDAEVINYEACNDSDDSDDSYVNVQGGILVNSERPNEKQMMSAGRGRGIAIPPLINSLQLSPPLPVTTPQYSTQSLHRSRNLIPAATLVQQQQQAPANSTIGLNHNRQRANYETKSNPPQMKYSPGLPLEPRKQRYPVVGAHSFHTPSTPLYQLPSVVSPPSAQKRKISSPQEVRPHNPPFSPPNTKEHEFTPLSDELELGEFVNRYKSEFPVQVRVAKGYYGTTDKWSISEGELFTIHFVKYTKTVAAEDALLGNYGIPLNSAARFGILPSSTQKGKAEPVVDYETVGKLINLSPLPLAAKATQTWQLKDCEERSITRGDVLIIQGVKTNFITRNRRLKCIDAYSGKSKQLRSNCAGFFTTQPSDTCLYLPEIIKYFKLPNMFQMFINEGENPDLPPSVVTRVVKLTHCSIETSLIATQLDVAAQENGAHPLIEIPINLDIEIQVVEPRIKDQIYEQTDHLYDTMDYANIEAIPSNAASTTADPLSIEALAACQKGGRRTVGIEIEQPPRYSATGDQRRGRSGATPYNSTASNDVFSNRPRTSRELTRKEKARRDYLESQMKLLSAQITGKC